MRGNFVDENYLPSGYTDINGIWMYDPSKPNSRPVRWAKRRVASNVTVTFSS